VLQTNPGATQRAAIDFFFCSCFVRILLRPLQLRSIWLLIWSAVSKFPIRDRCSTDIRPSGSLPPFESMDTFPCAAPSRVCDSVWISCCVILIYSVSIPIPYPLYAHSLPLPVAMIPLYFCGLILSLFHSNPFRVGLPSDTIYFCQFHGDETTRGMFMRRCNAPRFPVDNLVAR